MDLITPKPLLLQVKHNESTMFVGKLQVENFRASALVMIALELALGVGCDNVSVCVGVGCNSAHVAQINDDALVKRCAGR